MIKHEKSEKIWLSKTINVDVSDINSWSSGILNSFPKIFFQLSWIDENMQLSIKYIITHKLNIIPKHYKIACILANKAKDKGIFEES